jgi:tetratricopeptide (TPR) repeat protein
MSELLARLEPPRRRPIALAVAAGAFVVAAVAAALARTADACPADTALETLWTGHRRSELGQALDADGSEEIRAAWERALPRLDEYASGLHRELAAVCEVEDEQVADARRRCLARHAAHFDGLLLSATTGTKPDVWRLLEGLGRLPAVDGCTELSDAEEPRPSDPELAREVDRIRAELARVDAITTLADARCAEDGAPVDEAAHAVGFPPLLAEVDMVLGSCDMMTEQFDRATERLERSYLVATEHGHDLLAARAANALVSMNGLRLGNIEEAETWLRNAEAAIVRAGDPLEERIRLQQTSGSLREVQGRYDECEALLRAGREGALRLLPPSPSAVATLTQNLAICLDVGGRPEEAEPLYREALQIRIDDVGEMTPVVGETLLSLAAAMDTMSRFDERDELNERARMVLERTRGADSPQLGILLSNLSSTERQRGNLPMARAHAERALEILRRTLGEDSPYTAGAWNQLGRSAEFEQAWDEALRHYARAIAIFEAAFGPSHPNIATVLLNVATIHQGAGRFDEGEAAFGRALEIRRQANGPDSPEVWWLIESIGLLHREAGRLEEAEREIREGLAGLERTAPDPALVALAQFHLAETLRRADRSPDEARRLAHAALQTFETVKMQDRADAVRAWLADGG